MAFRTRGLGQEYIKIWRKLSKINLKDINGRGEGADDVLIWSQVLINVFNIISLQFLHTWWSCSTATWFNQKMGKNSFKLELLWLSIKITSTSKMSILMKQKSSELRLWQLVYLVDIPGDEKNWMNHSFARGVWVGSWYFADKMRCS